MTTGVELIAAERRRQVEVKGYDAERDAGHKRGELRTMADNRLHSPMSLMLSLQLKNLAEAGALIAAEIDRLQANAK